MFLLVEKPLVSVIVPVFNAESFVEECVASILTQTYSNLEVLLIDDGSSDRSLTLLKGIAEHDNRIIVITKNNGGVSSARNVGLDSASGDYIGFVDADDIIEPNMIEVLVSACLNSGSDVACCSFRRQARGSGLNPVQSTGTSFVINREEFLLGVITGAKGDCLIGGYLWNKLFSRRLFHGLRLDVDRIICEDLLFILELGQRINKACCVSDVLYDYMVTARSATCKLDNLVTPDGQWGYFETAKIIRDRYATTPMLAYAARLAMYGSAVNGLMHLVGNTQYSALYNKLRIYAKAEWPFCKSALSIRQRLRARLVTFHPRVYRILKHVWGSYDS